MKIVSTEKAPAAIGPYSQAMEVNGLVFTSGQIPINPADGSLVTGDIAIQAEQVMKNLGEVLKAAGCTYENAVKTTCFLADMNDFAAFNEVYGEIFYRKTGPFLCGGEDTSQKCTLRGRSDRRKIIRNAN